MQRLATCIPCFFHEGKATKVNPIVPPGHSLSMLITACQFGVIMI
jgi:hypothetical protein